MLTPRLSSLPEGPRPSGRGRSPAIPPLALRRRDAAEALGISVRSLDGLVRSGDIPHVRIGRAVVFRVMDLQSWLAKRSRGGGQ